MEKQLGWAHTLGRVEYLGISKAGETVLARLMESQIWHQPASSVGRGLSKAGLRFPLYTTGVFQAATVGLELRGSQSE